MSEKWCNTADDSSLRSYVQEKLLLSSPEASRQGMRGKQFLMYTMSADHPGYPVRQKYPQYNQPAGESCLYSMVCRLLFRLSGYPDNAFCHVLQDGKLWTQQVLPPG